MGEGFRGIILNVVGSPNSKLYKPKRYTTGRVDLQDSGKKFDVFFTHKKDVGKNEVRKRQEIVL